MTYQWDEFSKCVADDSLSRRQSLRWLGTAVAGAVLSPFGLGTAWAGKQQDPCDAFCNRCSKSQRQQCINTCRACNGNTSRLGGSCGKYTCCSVAACNGVCSDLRTNPNCGACGNDCRNFGEICCGGYCADLENDFDNCGSCGFRCPNPGPYEFGECIEGTCLYACVEGAVTCNGVCSVLDSDPNNCGACGNVCGGAYPSCQRGICYSCQPSCPEGWCGGNGCGGECGCPVGYICDSNYCFYCPDC